MCKYGYMCVKYIQLCVTCSKINNRILIIEYNECKSAIEMQNLDIGDFLTSKHIYLYLH